MTLEADVLRRVTPSAEEEQEAQRVVDDLLAKAQAALDKTGVAGRATVQGSLAKGTWLAGSADIDLFLLLDPGVPASRLETITKEVGRAVLSDAHTRYAQHPYLIGTFRGRTVDLVPAYAVAGATAKMSAVDRTPFHTAWVRNTLDEGGRSQVRLLKRWMKGTGTYGAQTATGGFSGYLAEVLVAAFGSFHGVVDWLAADAQPRRIVLPGCQDQVVDDVSPLVVPDPVDPVRNCAAGVHADTLALASAAAQAYKREARTEFFFPKPPRNEAANALLDHLARQHQSWYGVLIAPKTDRLDLVFPQFQKWARTVAAALETQGHPVVRHLTKASPDEREVLVQWVLDAGEKPATRIHEGPRDDGQANAEKFRAKWTGHPEAAGPVQQGAAGHLEVEVRNAERTATQWLDRKLAALPAGRHVSDALAQAKRWRDPAEVPAAWAPTVADHVLARRPWER